MLIMFHWSCSSATEQVQRFFITFVALIVREAKQQLFIKQQRGASATASSSAASTEDRLATPSNSAVGDNDYDNDTSQQPLTKKAKFFDFMAGRRPGPPGSISATASHTSQERQPCPNLNKQFYDLHHSDADSTCGLAVFNNPNLYGLRPLVQRLFCVPASSAASERLFSQAGLIMRPTRNRLSKDKLSQLVFLKCNMK